MLAKKRGDDKLEIKMYNLERAKGGHNRSCSTYRLARRFWHSLDPYSWQSKRAHASVSLRFRARTLFHSKERASIIR